MREELAQRRLVHEQPTGRQHTRDLGQRLRRAGDVVAGAEIHDQIERAVGKRHAADVARHELDGDARGVGPGARLLK